MHRSRRLVVLAAVTALTAVLAAPAGAGAAGLTVYSSLPLHGDVRPLSREMVAAMRRALRDAGGTAGGQPVTYISLDDSTGQAGKWTVGRSAANARKAAKDPSAIAYLGEFNSGASAISMPILNAAGILQISPGNTASSLTVGGPGSAAGEPGKYVPSGTRTYARLLPNDHVQGRAAAVLLQQLGAKSVLVVDDGEVYGTGVARSAADALAARGLRVGVRHLRSRARNRAAIAKAAKGYDALFYGGITQNDAPKLFNALGSNAKLIKVGSDGVSEPPFTRALTQRGARNTYMLSVPAPVSTLPPAGQALDQALGHPEIYALYAYEAMSLALDAINRGGATRPGAVAGLFATRDRDSVVGHYSIDANGDTTATTYGVYRPAGGRVAFVRTVDAGP
jgi:branched-chain amino acid transport system substrate-binding protein